jgi:pimeloyl-ACP methyl ester carboxylesterase
VPEVSDHIGEIDFPPAPGDGGLGAHGGLPVFWRSAPLPADRSGDAVPLYLHGVPNSSDDWVAPREHRETRPWRRRWWRRKRSDDEWLEPPVYELGFLERSGGLAVDLPGFGRSGKPGYLHYTIDEYDRFIERFLDKLGVERVQLVVHGWGAVGLAFAQRLPERVERLTIINAVPFLADYRWHRIARVWRTPGLGELAMGTTYRSTLRFASKEANATPGPMSGAWLDSALEHFDEGTQRAILRLYRSSPPEVLAAAGARLGRLEMPALVVWGLKDPYIPASFGREYASTLPHAELVELADAGHTPWLDRTDVLDRVVGFLSAG